MDVQGHAFLQELTATLADEQKRFAVKDDRPVILVTTVDIGGGKSDRIEFRKGDEPTDAAKAFCRKHNLPTTIVGPLTQHILDHLKKAGTTPDGKSLNIQDAVTPPLGFAGSPKPTEHSSKVQSAKQPFSFSAGMDDKLFEQLSSKLLPVDETRYGSGNVMSATDLLGHLDNSSGRQPRSAGSNNVRRPRAASTSPSPRARRDTVYNRLYGGALDRQARVEERRRMAAMEEDATLAATRGSMSWISSEMMKGRTSGLYENYGEMLYAEGIEAYQLKLRKAELERLERSEKELDGVTFQPAITKKAWELKMRESSVPDKDRDAKWARMYNAGMRKSTLERLDDLRRQREAAEVAECTFRPRINRASESMMAERVETLKVLNISHHDQLFQDAIRRQQKMAELANWYPDDVTFQPQVNKDARAMEYLCRSWEKVLKDGGAKDGSGSARDAKDGPGSPGPGGGGSVPPVVERLYASLDKRNQKLEEARARLNGPVDPTTGRALYRPETGRGPRNVERNRDGKPIGEYLYSVAQELAAKKAATEEEERRAAEEEASKARALETSQRMYLRLKLKRFIQIFEYLDEAGVGLIDLVGLVSGSTGGSTRSARVERLDNEVLADVEAAAAIWARAHNTSLHGGARPSVDGSISQPHSPLLNPQQQQQQPECPPLNQEQFLAVMESAISATRKPRAYLVPSPSAKYRPSHTFKPAINKRSKEMAAKLRPAEMAVHELLHQSATQIREKLEARRKALEDSALDGCTFAPRLNAASLRGVEGRALRSSGASSSMRYQAGIAAAAAGSACGSDAGFGGAAAEAVAAAAGAEADSAASAGDGMNGDEGVSLLGGVEEARSLEEFAALEQELSDMMAASALNKARIRSLQDADDAATAGDDDGAYGGHDGGYSAAEQQLEEVASAEALQAAMEDLLLRALQEGGRDGEDAERRLQDIMEAGAKRQVELQIRAQQQQALMGGAGAGGSRRGTREQAGAAGAGATSSMFVVPQGQGEQPSQRTSSAGCAMQDLAQELELELEAQSSN